MRIMAIDPGSKRIGLAISDQTGTFAQPLMIFDHFSKEKDLEIIIYHAINNKVETIIVGCSTDENGDPTFSGKRSIRLAENLKNKLDLPVILWDEYHSTLDARETRKLLNTTRKKRSGHLDDLAATIILQSYLEEQLNIKDNPNK